MSVLLLELNEVNFDEVERYVALGKLPVMGRLIARHGITETTSEKRYDELEPWIQWVTAHTGLSLAEHGVFRLGDIVTKEIPQIWEVLEAQGFTVGAISPMNAKNRCTNPAFFVPDPWTRTAVSGSLLMRRLYDAIAQAVNDNASARLTPRSTLWLLAGLVAYARKANWPAYLSMVLASARSPWTRALVLDQLLSDLFIRQVKRAKPDFASLFLNAAAHIQHHYMFNSSVYQGSLRNPEWYLNKEADPVLDVYAQYDRIVGQIERSFPESRLLLATGLHQNAHGEVTFYWRLTDHAAFLRKLDIPFHRVEPRMSRDFVVFCDDAETANDAALKLRAVVGPDATPLFEVDVREDTLFVMLIWSKDIGPDFEYHSDRPLQGFRDDVTFVAIKNGEHDGVGYLLDTRATATPERARPRIELRELPKLTAMACGGSWPA